MPKPPSKNKQYVKKPLKPKDVPHEQVPTEPLNTHEVEIATDRLIGGLLEVLAGLRSLADALRTRGADKQVFSDDDDGIPF